MSGRRLPLRVLVSAVGVVAVGSLARADAPPGQYQAFDLSDVTIVDLQTGLEWQRYASPPTTLANAFAACASLSLGGTSPRVWRLPSYKELLTLVDEAPHVEYPAGLPVPIAIDGNAFPHIGVDNPYWSSSPYAQASGDDFVVEFSGGSGLYQAPNTPAYVRCVR